MYRRIVFRVFRLTLESDLTFLSMLLTASFICDSGPPTEDSSSGYWPDTMPAVTDGENKKAKSQMPHYYYHTFDVWRCVERGRPRRQRCRGPGRAAAASPSSPAQLAPHRQVGRLERLRADRLVRARAGLGPTTARSVYWRHVGAGVDGHGVAVGEARGLQNRPGELVHLQAWKRGLG